jgi:hypothetical protein
MSQLATRPPLIASLVAIAPLVLAYQIGVLFAGNVNGADMVTRAAYTSLGRTAYLLVHVGAAIAFLVWIRRSERWHTLRLAVLGPLVVEAAIYALTLAAVITLAIDRIVPFALSPGNVVNAIGAGVYEELVFRLGVLVALAALLRRATPHRALVFTLALLASSLLFAAAHHVGPGGEPYHAHVFAARCVAGAVFGAVFWFRSLAHAVYAHALYDILIFARAT